MNACRALGIKDVLKTLNTVECDHSVDAVTQRIKYTDVDRETLEPQGSILIPAYFNILFEKQATGNLINY